MLHEHGNSLSLLPPHDPLHAAEHKSFSCFSAFNNVQLVLRFVLDRPNERWNLSVSFLLLHKYELLPDTLSDS